MIHEDIRASGHAWTKSRVHACVEILVNACIEALQNRPLLTHLLHSCTRAYHSDACIRTLLHA